ncbi:hypothetical protein AVEN_78909-1, partial [Araneus ventricosus]
VCGHRSRWPSGKVSTSGRRVPSSKPDFTEEPPCKRAMCTLNPSGSNVLPLMWCGSLEKGCLPRCRLRHMTANQNDENRPKIALVLLYNGT